MRPAESMNERAGGMSPLPLLLVLVGLLLPP